MDSRPRAAGQNPSSDQGQKWPAAPRHVVPATQEMVRRLAGRLSADHRREIADTGWLGPAAALLLSLSLSAEAYGYVPGRTGAVFVMGVERAGAITGTAMVWMIGTDAVKAHPAGTLRAARWGLRRAFAASGAERLEQFIPVWYRTGLRFARRLGFRLEPCGFRTAGGNTLLHAVIDRREASWV